jgi:D-3-phosphoglycerate dehydrogenase
MSEYQVVVTDHDFDDLDIERDVLGDVATVEALGDDVGEVTTEGVESTLARADAVLNLRYQLEGRHIDRMTNCRIIARYGIGVDNVDVETATEHGIPVTNVPGYCIEEVSTHAVTLALALVRGVKPYDQSIAAGSWDREDGSPIRRLSTLTVGVVGYGSIGRAVADRFLALGADVVTSDPYVDESDVADSAVDLLSFEDLVEQADVLTVHSPLTESTRELIDATVFDALADHAYLINVSRGPIVDTDDLYAALEAGDVAGAGIDVFPDEPPSADDPLRDHPAVLTTPHVAWYSEEANDERRRRASENVRRALTGGELENVVNTVDTSE